MKKLILAVPIIILLVSCSNINTETTQVGENTFVYKEKVFRIIDNEITELGNLKTDTITKSRVLNPELKNYGKNNLDYVENGASSSLTAVYRETSVLIARIQLKQSIYEMGSKTGSINVIADSMKKLIVKRIPRAKYIVIEFSVDADLALTPSQSS